MHFEYGAITRYDVGFQQLLLYIHFITLLVKRHCCLTTPAQHRVHNADKSFVAHSVLHRFGLFPFRSPLLGESRDYVTFFSFPPGTEMFHFPGYAPVILMMSGY